jgi:hypothetical protein
MTSMESRPALSAMVFGTTSRAFAKLLMTSCYLPEIYFERLRRRLDSYI